MRTCCPSAAATRSEGAWRFRFEKQFHVSPFMPMDMRYDWRFSAPGSKLHVHMENWRDGRSAFDATLNLEREQINSASLARALAGFPLMTAQVTSLIHWQALKLWCKRTPFYHASEARLAPYRPADAEERLKDVSVMSSRPSIVPLEGCPPGRRRGLRRSRASGASCCSASSRSSSTGASASSSREGEHRFGKRTPECDLGRHRARVSTRSSSRTWRSAAPWVPGEAYIRGLWRCDDLTCARAHLRAQPRPHERHGQPLGDVHEAVPEAVPCAEPQQQGRQLAQHRRALRPRQRRSTS